MATSECARFREQAGIAREEADILRMDYDVINDEVRKCEKGWKDTTEYALELEECMGRLEEKLRDAREGARR